MENGVLEMADMARFGPEGSASRSVVVIRLVCLKTSITDR
jgi:hypothetical protein